ncbi:hypothetical protein GOV11_05235 [Candidatus Woesearchaeota archaeon]|nr:hypothetical protein [Candidatus Woesearchaeota archaeon]
MKAPKSLIPLLISTMPLLSCNWLTPTEPKDLYFPDPEASPIETQWGTVELVYDGSVYGTTKDDVESKINRGVDFAASQGVDIGPNDLEGLTVIVEEVGNIYRAHWSDYSFRENAIIVPHSDVEGVQHQILHYLTYKNKGFGDCFLFQDHSKGNVYIGGNQIPFPTGYDLQCNPTVRGATLLHPTRNGNCCLAMEAVTGSPDYCVRDNSD